MLQHSSWGVLVDFRRITTGGRYETFNLGYRECFAAELGLANAADMPVKARPLPPPAPVFSWTGFYIGAHVGGAWGTTESTLNSVLRRRGCECLFVAICLSPEPQWC